MQTQFQKILVIYENFEYKQNEVLCKTHIKCLNWENVKCTILAQFEFDGNNVKKKSWDRAMYATV